MLLICALNNFLTFLALICGVVPLYNDKFDFVKIKIDIVNSDLNELTLKKQLIPSLENGLTISSSMLGLTHQGILLLKR